MATANATADQVTLSGRELALMRRKAMALHGKAASVKSSQAPRRASQPVYRAEASEPVPSRAASEAALMQAAQAQSASSGRQIAMQRRTARALKGRTGGPAAAAKPSGRMRTPAASVPASTSQHAAPSGAGALAGAQVVNAAHKVTGTQAGSERTITGTEFLSSHLDLARENRAPSAAPRRVSVMPSQGEKNPVRSDVERSTAVTGDEFGSSRQLTGTQYTNVGDVNAARQHSGSPKTPASLAQDQTWRGQSITGTHVGRSNKMTGDEPGGCAPISGTPYIGRKQYKEFCNDPQLAAQQTRLRSEGVIAAAVVTGDRPGAGGSVMTGDDRGACELITGSPYIGLDNRPLNCQTSGRFVPMAGGQAAPPAAPAPADFSIKSPSMQARERNSADAITGTNFSTQRITGPVNKAGGLITGTPEFRHHEPSSFQAKSQAASQVSATTAAERLTGEGSQAGTQISGDAWQSSGRVTGTEGTSSLMRNPSQRGEPRGVVMNAQQFRDVERAAPPESRITGSSGSTSKGAAVTVSGGARG